MTYHEEYAKAVDALSVAVQAQRKAASLKGDVQSLQAKCDQLKSVWIKEQKDVERFERLSLSSFIASITGSIDSRLEKEQQEALEAKMAYDSVVFSLEQTKDDLARIQVTDHAVERLQERVDTLFDQLLAYTIQNDPTHGPRLQAINGTLQEGQHTLREIGEALSVGLQLDAQLKEVLNILDSARNWGLYDMVAGGLIASAIKHDRLDRAKQQIDEAVYLLKRFNTELADVSKEIAGDLQFDGFTRFADLFFDNFFFDWFVQDKIVNVTTQTKELQRRVRETLDALRLERNALEEKNLTLHNEQESILRVTGPFHGL